MTQDSRTQRTPAVDAGAWSPFDGRPVDGTAPTGGTADADVRPSTVRADATGWRPRVIDGGRGRLNAAVQDAVTVDEDTAAAGTEDGPAVDVLDAAAADVLAIFDAPAVAEPEAAPAVVEPEPEVVAPKAPEFAPEAPTAAPAAAPQAPVAPAQEATPHPTLHTLDQATPVVATPAQSRTGSVETPHSTPWLRTAVGWLNPYDVLDQPLPPVSAIYDAARASVADRSGPDKGTELVWVYAIGMPVTVACYTLAAAVQRKWRGLGTSTIVALWIAAANTAPVDTSLIWTWTAIGYWVSTAFILPAVIQAKK